MKRRIRSRNPRPAHAGLARLKNYEPGKPIEELERELGVKNAVKLASNENPWGPSPAALRAMRKAAARVHRYPDAGAHLLRRELSRKFRVPTDRIVLGNGSDELIVMAMRAFVPPGSEIMTATPTFLIYKIAGTVQGARVNEIPMKDFRYDLERMARAVSPATRAIFIANPDNPMGTYVRERELMKFMTSVPSRCLVFLDEAYFEYARGERGYPRSLSFWKRMPNLVIARTFSKVYGLAGLRVGYAFAHPQVADLLNRVREPFNVNALAQAAAVAAISDEKFLRRVLASAKREKQILCAALKKMNIPVLPSATNFLILKIGSGAGRIYRELLAHGVIVRSMAGWGLDDYLRVTVGRPSENRRFLSALTTTMGRA
ncbi:MAG: histidinol-phosphate transaminase [Candidatus Omnitrophica bacterium]|nr:histidinol-phosphate transaminase [Candidatus Omnitrophota bacterium]